MNCYRYPDIAALIRSAALSLLLVSCGGGGGGGSSVEPLPNPIPQGELIIRGTIAVAPAVTVDVDTNDPDAPAYSGPDNDLPYDDIDSQTTLEFSGQLVPNPGAAGGFLAFRGQGASGPATASGDLHDFYRIPLIAGQTVSLVIANHIESDPARNDLDLLLLNLDGFLIDFAAGIGSVEGFVVQETGEYFVLVTACANDLNPAAGICGAGASNYLLTVGQGDAPAAGLRLSADFVPGEALVRYRDNEPTANAESNKAAAFTASALTATGGAELGRAGDVRRVALPLNMNAISAAAVASRTAAASVITVPPELEAKLATLAAIKNLQQRPEVAAAEPNYIRQPLYEPTDPGYKYQWHYPLINLPAAWDLGIFGANVTVAVLDTGILPRHPDLVGQIDPFTGGYDFVSSVFSSLDGDGPDPDPTDPGDGSSFGFTSSFHGTHVAGTVAAAMDNEGVTGVAPGARILPVRVLGSYGGTSFDIRQGICFAAGLSTGDNCAGVPANSNPADIINMSLGGSDPSLLEQGLIEEVRAAGVLIVASAGNGASSAPSYPAAYDDVIAVSAVGPDKARAPYSSFGSFVDVTAPGGNLSRDLDGDGYADGVLSTGGNDAGPQINYVYPFFQGTSMSAPHVAGVLALMRAANDEMLPDVVDTLLAAGDLTIPLGNQTGRTDSFGYGLIDAQKALAAALAAGGKPPAPRPWLGVTPGGLNFGATLEALEITLRNNSSGSLAIQAIESDAEWLTVPPVNGLGDYTLRVDRRNLVEGSYAATVTVKSDVNEVQIPVIVQKSNLVFKGDAGHLYVRLIDPATGLIRQVEADAVDGKYTWRIRDLPPGDYQLVAFTDADNDNKLCDRGEACGSYLTSDQPLLIDVQADRSGLDFPVNFGVALSDPDDSPK